MLPLFPLQLVVFPQERLPLHIFEMRYRQLIAECEANQTPFGIPTFIKGELGFGTEVTLEKIVRKHPDGKLDIICRGQKIFKLESFYNPLPGKLYAGGEVTYLYNFDDSLAEQKQRLLSLINQLYALIGVAYQNINAEELDSYLYAHKVGLNLEQEYQLLQMVYESERLNYLIHHLEAIIPVVKGVNKTKELIQLNGHFKNFDPLDFEDFKL